VQGNQGYVFEAKLMDGFDDHRAHLPGYVQATISDEGRDMTGNYLRVGLLAFALGLAGPASATPPQSVTVDDVLFGGTPTHILLLRNIEDNMGLHSVTQTDIVLIARNRLTNADDMILPVARSIDYGPYFAEDGLENRVEVLPLQGAVDPFGVLNAESGWPMVGWSLDQGKDEGFTSTSDNDGFVVTSENSAQTYRLDFDDLGRHMTESIAANRSALPAYFAEAGNDVLQEVRFDHAKNCRLMGVRELYDRVANIGLLANIRCVDVDEVAPISMILSMTRLK
jgi:hypothetical protein